MYVCVFVFDIMRKYRRGKEEGLIKVKLGGVGEDMPMALLLVTWEGGRKGKGERN